MKTTRVYDWATRIFHWLFAGSFVAAFFIAKAFDDESSSFPIHMLIGFGMVALVALRLVWGLVGSKYARFSSFRLRPAELVGYFKNLLSGKGERSLGHNPASSWAALIMMTLAIGLGVTGYLMTSGGNKEALEEVHELLANAFLIVAVTHVAGVALHSLVHRDRLALSMIHGRKKTEASAAEAVPSHWGAGLIFLALMGGFVFQLKKNYDPTRQTLSFLGTSLRLGESEGNEREGKSAHSEREGSEEGDDD